MKKRTKNTIGYALKVWGRTIVAAFLCAIVFFSVSMFGSVLMAKTVGYRIYENGNEVPVTEYYFKDGETAENTNPELEEGQTLSAIRQMSDGVKTGLNVVSEIMMLVIVAVFPYDMLWKLGAKDRNKVECGRIRPDLWRGLRIGALSQIPYGICYLLLIGARFSLLPKWYLSVYRIVNIPFLPYINTVSGEAVAPTAVSLWGMLGIAVTLLFVPAICTVSYRLGYKEFSVQEKLTYKKKDK